MSPTWHSTKNLLPPNVQITHQTSLATSCWTIECFREKVHVKNGNDVLGRQEGMFAELTSSVLGKSDISACVHSGVSLLGWGSQFVQ